MRFLSITDIDGRHHLVNLAHITVVEDDDAGCAIHLRGRLMHPIVVEQTTEVMNDVLTAIGESESRGKKHRRSEFP